MAELQDFGLWPLTRDVTSTTTSTPGVVGPYSAGRPGQIGSVLGFWTDDARNGRKQTLQIDGVKNTPAVFPLDEWRNGQKLYWNQSSGVIATLPTDAWFGWAAQVSGGTDIVKASGAGAVNGYVMLRPGPTRDADFSATFDHALQSAILIQDAQFLARNYSTDSLAIPKEGTVPAQVISGTFWHDGNVAVSGAATIALGTTPGGVDIMAATLVTTLVALGNAYTENAITLATAEVTSPAVYMTVAAADITAGRFRFRLENQAE